MRWLVLSLVIVANWVSLAAAQSPYKIDPTKPTENKPVAVPEQEKLFKKFEESMAGAKLVGSFTVIGKDDKGLKKDEYTIVSVTKLPEGDYWLFKAKFKDATFPLPLEVKWAGDTPVITLTDFTIPGLGTFSSRVMLYRDAYAGWWQHGEVSGHMFGSIERATKEDTAKPDEKKPAEKPVEPKVEEKK